MNLPLLDEAKRILVRKPCMALNRKLAMINIHNVIVRSTAGVSESQSLYKSDEYPDSYLGI